MITCPSCNHQNPEGSLQCENCYTPLPATTSCPNCGASVQTDATFCGQCGFNLQAENTPLSASIEETAIGSMTNMSIEDVSLPDELPLSGSTAEIMPETAMSSMSSPIQSPWDDDDDAQTMGQPRKIPSGFPEVESSETANLSSEIPETNVANLDADLEPNPANEATMPWQSEAPELDSEVPEPAELNQESEAYVEQAEVPEALALESPAAAPVVETEKADLNAAAIGSLSGITQLQIDTASLLHLQSNTTIEILSHLDVVHIGKPNAQIPPDIDVAGFPDSEVVSRIHADIRIEGDAYYIEDVGSSNGTYINHAPLVQGNRHRLRKGDRIALGKGDLVTFIFQLN